MICRGCGCTEDRPCLLEIPGLAPVPCSWVAPGLCSGCTEPTADELASFVGRELEPPAPSPLLVDQFGAPLVFK